MTVCLFTDYWIYGNQTRLSQNPTAKIGDTRILNYTFHRIGLWRECVRETKDIPYTCEIVKYSKEEAKLEKGFKAVSYRSAPSMACFTAASVLLILAIFLFTRGLCKRRRKAVFFISGLLFSISGLLTMVGVTLYVSITTEESVKYDQNFPLMNCDYGYSFLCAVLSFVLQELTGVLTVYWFIYRFRALVRKQEKLRERTRQLMGNCLSMTTALPLNLASWSPTNNTTNSITNRSNQNHVYYQHASNDVSNPLIQKQQQQQRRRIPFDKSYSPQPLQRIDKTHYTTITPVRSPTLNYRDYCRVLIRAEDMDLLTQMVKSKSQAQLLANSRPTTPAPTINTKISANSRISRQTNDNTIRRNTRKGVKRTTSV
ncbi:unnamed protein product [Rotaria sordida]|uniref:Voltage-dependent calcium channel gamma-5 subunit n=1 Tax=Rotaria sordida TaxID=392033 RepID=A0A813ZG32_9BILA|nr:unnamed protein product [Rotaria sordida]CAF1177331.1 unnamed protein product [Rotaria sordida]